MLRVLWKRSRVDYMRSSFPTFTIHCSPFTIRPPLAFQPFNLLNNSSHGKCLMDIAWKTINSKWITGSRHLRCERAVVKLCRKNNKSVTYAIVERLAIFRLFKNRRVLHYLYSFFNKAFQQVFSLFVSVRICLCSVSTGPIKTTTNLSKDFLFNYLQPKLIHKFL